MPSCAQSTGQMQLPQGLPLEGARQEGRGVSQDPDESSPRVRGIAIDTILVQQEERPRSISKLKCLARERRLPLQQLVLLTGVPPSTVLRNGRGQRRGCGRGCGGRCGRGCGGRCGRGCGGRFGRTSLGSDVQSMREAVLPTPPIFDDDDMTNHGIADFTGGTTTPAYHNWNPSGGENMATKVLRGSNSSAARGARRRLPLTAMDPNLATQDPPRQSPQGHGTSNQCKKRSTRGRGARRGRGRSSVENLDSSDEDEEDVGLQERAPPGWERPTIKPSHRSPPVLRKRLEGDGRAACASTGCGGVGIPEAGRGNEETTPPRRRWSHDGSPQHRRSTQHEQFGSRECTESVQAATEVGENPPVDEALPDALHVPLNVLGYDRNQWGGLQHFVGEPTRHWEEDGEQWFEIDFGGGIGKHNVREVDTRGLNYWRQTPDRGTHREDSLVEPGQAISLPHDGSFLNFPTQRLAEESHTVNSVRLPPLQPSPQLDCNASPQPHHGDMTRYDGWMDDSTDTEWMAEWRDFTRRCSSGNEYLEQGSESEESLACRQPSDADEDLLCELGVYGDTAHLDRVPFRTRYDDRYWQSEEPTLVGDRGAFLGPCPRPRYRSSRRRPSAGHFFDLFWADAVVDRIVEQVNVYANQQGTMRCKGTNGGPYLVDTTRKELRAFLGVVILMGIKSLPTIQDYWKQRGFLHCDVIPRVFTRNRFESLLRCLHLVNNEELVSDKGDPRYDRIGKVRWIVDHFVARSRELWNPEKFVTADEIMVAYRGHFSSIRQYMKAKPTKYGLKVWALVCNPSRYIFNLMPYLGSGGVREKDQGEQVVNELVSGLDNLGHVCVMDNFFTSPALFESLYNQGIWATGTVKAGRLGMPPSLFVHKKGEHPRGTLFWKMHCQRRMAACAWYDSKLCYFLSTSADPIGDNVFALRWRNGIRGPVPSRPLQVEYQAHMRGVDVVDQMRRDYIVQFHSHKWWHKLFFFVLDSYLLNGWVSYKFDREGQGMKIGPRLGFHFAVAEYLIQPWLDVPETYKESLPLRQGAIHFSSKFPGGKEVRRKCVVCGKKQQFRCQMCGDAAMCLGDCFVKVHACRKWALRVRRH